MPDKFALTLAWSKLLWEKHGISCFPMSTEAKRPLVRTSEWWGRHFPVDALARFHGCNISAQTGMVSRLLVIDVDSVSHAREWFQANRVLPSSWSVRTGSGGLHLWYKVPDWWTAPFGNTKLVKGEKDENGRSKHNEIAVIFDRGMAVCPPSKFPGGRPYKFESDRSPLTRPLGYAPEWLLQACIRSDVKPAPAAMNNETLPVYGSSASWKDLAESVPDKLSLLQSWGLRLAGSRINASGWVPCHRPGERDEVPSASVRPDTGQVWTSTGGTMSFVTAAVLLGAFTTETECAEWIRQNYAKVNDNG